MNFQLLPDPVERRWDGETVIVAATGPSLTKEVAELCRGHRVIAVNDAYKLLPFADVLYASDAKWWDHHQHCDGFQGEKWSAHGLPEGRRSQPNDKRQQFRRYKLHIVSGKPGVTFSTNPAFIHYGSNSGFQATNLAIHFGAELILLVGFDMRVVNNKSHFFGDHPTGFTKSSPYHTFIAAFNAAAKVMPPGVRITNCTENSALKCFPFMDLNEAVAVREAA